MVAARPSPAHPRGPRRGPPAALSAPAAAWIAALFLLPAAPAQEPGPGLGLELTADAVPVSAAWSADWSLTARGGLAPIAVDAHPSGVVVGLERRRHRLFLLDRAGGWVGFGGQPEEAGQDVGFAQCVFARSGLKIFTLDAEARVVDQFDLRGRWEMRFDFGTAAEEANATVVRAVDFGLDRAGDLYVLDAGRGSVLHFDPEGEFVARLETWGDWQPVDARALEVDGRGRLFLLGGKPAAVWVLEPSGRLVEQRPVVPPQGKSLDPSVLAVDVHGNAFVGGDPAGRIRVLPGGGEPPWWITPPEGRTWRVADLAVDGDRRLLVADPGAGCIRVITLQYRVKGATRGPARTP